MMSWHLFLDDEREPSRLRADTVICRTAAEARAEVSARGCPVEMDLDHDLGDGEDTMGFLRWFANEVMDGKLDIPKDFTFAVHSQNPVGRANINGFLAAFLRSVEDDARTNGL